MRTAFLVAVAIFTMLGTAQAKDKRVKVAAVEQGESAEQQKMLDELKSILQPRTVPLHVKVMPGMGVKDVFPRWSHAVCIGCDHPPKPPRVLHTYPYRILAGVLAGEDDERERRGIRLR